MLDGAESAHHASCDLPLEPQRPDQFLARGVERLRQPSSAIVGVYADVGAVQPVAVRLVRRQPAALNDVGKGVRAVGEIKVQPNGRRGGNHAIPVKPDQLALGEQCDVLPVVRRLEAFFVGQRREHHALELFEGLGMLRSCRGDNQAVRQHPPIRAHAHPPRSLTLSTPSVHPLAAMTPTAEVYSARYLDAPALA